MSMAAGADLIARSGDLKGELVAFAEGRRFSRALQQAYDERFGPWDIPDNVTAIDFLDRFVLNHRLKDGRAIVEAFVTEHPELPDEERAMLLGWRDVVEGIFEVQRLDGEALIVLGLVDELSYRVRSNAGPSVLAGMKPGSFLITRLVPIADEWLLSGISRTLPASQGEYAYQSAMTLASEHPALVFRNPEKLALAWELQRTERAHFVAFFGSDLVVLPGAEVAERMAAYAHYRMHEERDAAGRTVDEYFEEKYGSAPPTLDFGLPPELTEADTVGIVYDDLEGLNFYVNFGRFEATFTTPELADQSEHRKLVLDYLEDPSISPLPFRRQAARDPARASEVLRRVLGRRRFSWQRDGEALMKRYKARCFERPMLPAVTPLSDRLTRAQLSATDAGKEPEAEASLR